MEMLLESKNLMPFRINFSSRFSGIKRVLAGAEIEIEVEALIMFGLGRGKERREARGG